MLAMDATIPVIPTARVLLTEAEAAYRGWISADAKTLYEAGIKASFDQWGATGADAYVKSPAIAYNASKGLEQIALQRWIAGYLAFLQLCCHRSIILEQRSCFLDVLAFLL